MAKIRVHELSKQMELSTKDILSFLGDGFTVQSGLDEAQVELVKEKAKALEKSKSLEKRAVLVKAEKREEKPASPAETPVKAEKPADSGEKAAAQAETVKKKKPVFLFRPENSKTSFGDKFAKSGKPSEKGRSEADHRDSSGTQGRIKANVPTTAQQYRDYAKDDLKKEAPKPEKPKNEAESTHSAPVQTSPVKPEKAEAPAPSEQPEKKAAPVEKAVEVKAAEVKELAAVPAPEEPQKAPVEALPSEKPQKETVESVQKSDASAIQTPVKKPEERKPEEKKSEVKKPEAAEKKPETVEKKPAARPSINILGKVDLNQVKASEEKKSSDSKKGIFGKNSSGKVHLVDNRGKDERKPFDKNRPASGTGPKKPFGDKPGEHTQGRPGAKDNRGIFSKDGARQGGPRIHVNSANASGEKLVSKSDVRGQKGSGKGGKKTDFDRNKDGKKAENFKNLTKDQNKKPKEVVEEEVIKMISLPEVITIKDLSDKMKMKPAELIKKLFLQGKMMTLNSELTYEEAEALALEYDILSEKEVEVNVIEELLKEDEEDEKLMKKRPPVVCVMGHVDHGKTSLLDAIRRTNVTSREAGGITQHIGAYTVECKGERITFLDTPGHEAFTAMRMRGAQATDIAILVVAADDGVMPQTVEAINHAKSANVDVIVAVNKIDKPAANVDRVKQELMEYGLVAEEWGGNTIFVPVSAKTGENIDTLLEMILLVTEVKELKANPNREMRGVVIEAKLDKGRGPVATVLVQKGTLKQGDFVSAGSTYGRVRAMLDADGNAMKAATPSTPVEILGLNGVPNAGEVCLGHKNEKQAREYADTFIAEEKKKKLAESKHKLTVDSLFDQIQAGNLKELPLVVKADVQGSVEAIKSSLEKLSNDEITVRVIHSGVGAISESDVTLASAANAIVIGFNIKPDAQAKALAESESVDMRLYTIIYQAIDDIEAAMKGMKAPVYEEKILAHAEVRMTFKASGVGVIAGSYVLDGTIERNAKARITRGKETVFDGNIASLKRFKDDVKEVREGFECGIVFEKFNDIQEGDQVEVYKMVQVTEE
ncbi:MAG: translation initiation factor IF-2 [Lachnospiraceae bacterium]|nr:translation initiation factor IF-2 [Lachnospiraceae bacterium]